MAEYSWPSREEARIIGKDTNRVDGMVKTTGVAKYTYDAHPKQLLVARVFGCPHAHCKVKSIDTAAAEKTPGVVHVHVFDQGKPGSEVNYDGDPLVAVAAESDAAAREGVAAVKIEFELLDAFTKDEDLQAATEAGRTSRAGGSVELVNEPGENDDDDEWENAEIERLLQQSKYVVEGYYGVDMITHCCLEPHGATAIWDDGKLTAYLSTQNVSGTDEQFAGGLEITADEVTVLCEYVGGGFGSKFAADHWCIAAGQIARSVGRPVRLMLDRDQELKVAGNRPSGFIEVRLGADEKGVIQIWDSKHWGTTGYGRRGSTVSANQIPYVIAPKNIRREATGIQTNSGPSRAWRAPNHPQGCAMTQPAVDDLAAKMGADSLEVFRANLRAGNVSTQHPRGGEIYLEELEIAEKLMGWKEKWHLHGKGRARGSIVDGLGLGIHTWGGGANASDCRLRIYPDGSVETFCGTQDLGTGTRTVCHKVVAETLGLGVSDVRVNIGSSKYPPSGPSGGSTTVGAVCESHRRAAQDALEKLCALAAQEIGADAGSLEARAGKIQVRGDASKSISWKKACAKVGVKPLEVTARYARGSDSPLSSTGVGGVQMAHVEVDKETGVIKVKKLVAVQDQGLVINPKTCKSQIYGAITMGISSALFEQQINDPATGLFVNAELSDYKLARLGDIGEIIAEIYEPEIERSRGVIGNGEPPVVSPATAISNAVCNALGVRVPVLPLTPKRVLDALNQAGGRA